MNKKSHIRFIGIFYLIFAGLITIFCVSCSDTNQNPSSDLGIQATNPSLDPLMETLPKPSLSKTGKSLLTSNKMGFDVLDHAQSQTNWLLDEFYAFVKEGEKTVLDVGCGYGTLSLKALSDQNIVIANDLSMDHLIEVRRRAISQNLNLSHLYLNHKSFPHSTEFQEKSLDVIMLHRVLHFLSPSDIEEGLKRAYRWLKPKGKVFIVVMAPQHKQFSWFLHLYEKRWSDGNKWPGVDLLAENALPDQAYNLPKYLHVMDGRPLYHVLVEKCGFKIEQMRFISMKHFGDGKDFRDGHEAFGVIAVKQ